MKISTYICGVILWAALILAGAVNAQAANTNVQLIMNGNAMTWRFVEPVSQNGRVFVPAREFTESIGGEMGWHTGHQQASLFYREHVMVFTVGQSVVTWNGRRVNTGYAAFMNNERIMIPLRFVAESFGYEVGWCHTKAAATVDLPGRLGNVPGVPLPTPTPTPTPTPQLPLPTPAPTPTPEIPLPTPTPPPNNNHGNGPGTEIPPEEMARNVSTAPINAQIHPETTIISLFTPNETGTCAYIINAFSAISSVEYFVLADNRLVIDISRASSSISGPFYIPAHLPIENIRVSQFSRNPNVTRLVFDLIGPVEFNLSLSADRRNLMVSFTQNSIVEITASTHSGSDIFMIRGETIPAIHVEMDRNNRRLMIEINNAVMHVDSRAITNAAFASHFITGQRENGTSFVHIYLRDGVDIPQFGTIPNNGMNMVSIMLHATVESITYNRSLRAVRICRAGGFTMDVSQIQRFDEYLRNRYTMVLPASANALEQGTVIVNDGYINSFMLARDINGNTQLIFNTARVLAFVIEETPEAYYVIARLPREVYSLVVVIDPGHGGHDPGTVRNGIYESHYVLAISHEVARLVNRHPNVRVYMTRWEDVFVGPFWRSEFANDFADVFLSVHANSVINTSVHGIETLYYITEYEANLRFNSRHFAQIVQNQKIAHTGAHNRNLFNRPDLIVLRTTMIPAVISELGFISNPAEAARMATPEYQAQLVQALYAAIMETHRQIGR